MPDAALSPRAHLSQLAWRNMLATRDVWWPWVVMFGVIYDIIRMAMPVPPQLPPEEIKHNPVLIWHAMLQPVLPYFIALLALSVVSTYVMAIIYLGTTDEKPVPGIKNFFHWLVCYLAKVWRPVLWLLLPVIGAFFYFRSLLRRTTLTPMAVLGQDHVLQASWELGRDNVWRIFWHGLVLQVKISFLSWLAVVVTVVVAFFSAYFVHADSKAIAILIGHLFQGGVFGLLSLSQAVYSSTVYFTLRWEKQENTLSPSA
jgi:hypothetical protein